ncbi:fimbrial protein [Enterobacter mori]|uniref:fimbrial protein n=1 Tax=Enterobacter mori TaxID=539813 RepID=UPI003B8446A3
MIVYKFIFFKMLLLTSVNVMAADISQKNTPESQLAKKGIAHFYGEVVHSGCSTVPRGKNAAHSANLPEVNIAKSDEWSVARPFVIELRGCQNFIAQGVQIKLETEPMDKLNHTIEVQISNKHDMLINFNKPLKHTVVENDVVNHVKLKAQYRLSNNVVSKAPETFPLNFHVAYF